MELKIKINPIVIKKNNKSEILNLFRIYSYQIGNRGSFNVIESNGNKCALLVNYVKFNRKTLQKKVNGKTKSTIVREKHWIGYVYKIPIKLLEEMKLKVIQKNRCFVIESN